MKGLRKAVFRLCVVLAFLADAATAQNNPPARTIRQYDSRIQMHTAPVTLQVPDDSLETQKGAPESTDHDLMFPDRIPQESQIRPNGPRLKAMPEKQQNKNWILPSSTETEKKDEETTRDQQEEPVPSGWGWLADDVRAHQQKQEDDQENSDSKEKDKEFQPQSALQKEDANPKTDGIFLDTAFKPVSSSTPTKDNEKDKAEEDTSARDGSREQQRSRTDGPTTVESPRSRPSADQPGDREFGADATWGNESLWSKKSRPGTLPQTEALLSMSKLDAKKQVAGLDRPRSKPDVGGNTTHRVEPDQTEPARQSFVAAASFQPLPATPVNDLGNTPWDGGLPGRTPFGGSTPSSPEAGVTPSQPVESPRALELPKPVSSPWLR